MAGFLWRSRPWEETVISELHVGCFAGGHLPRCNRALPHLAGPNHAIEIMPSRNSRCAGLGLRRRAALCSHNAYGKRMTEGARGCGPSLGLTVLLDGVYNHFGRREITFPAMRAASSTRIARHPGERRSPSRRNGPAILHQNALYWLGEFRFDGCVSMRPNRSAIRPGRISLALEHEVRETFAERQHPLVLEDAHRRRSLLQRDASARACSSMRDGTTNLHNALTSVATGETKATIAPSRRALGQDRSALAHGFAVPRKG